MRKQQQQPSSPVVSSLAVPFSPFAKRVERRYGRERPTNTMIALVPVRTKREGRGNEGEMLSSKSQKDRIIRHLIAT